MFLHARELSFDHPASGQRVTLQAALPAECQRLVEVDPQARLQARLQAQPQARLQAQPQAEPQAQPPL